jgi:hypothetical protein
MTFLKAARGTFIGIPLALGGFVYGIYCPAEPCSEQ